MENDNSLEAAAEKLELAEEDLADVDRDPGGEEGADEAEEQESDEEEEEEEEEDIGSGRERALEILTWAKSRHKYKPSRSQKNWSVEMISIREEGLNLKKISGKGTEIQSLVLSDARFTAVINAMVAEVEKKNLKVISVCCVLGRHRSVAVAEILKRKYYPKATVRHLDL